MAETYADMLKVQIGKVTATAVVDNYFPLAGSKIKIDAKTKWAKTSEWQTQDGGGRTATAAGRIVAQADSKEVVISAAGDLVQKFITRNALSETVVQKTVYAMMPQVLPYFDVRVSKEVVRTDGEVTQIQVRKEFGYLGTHTIEVRVYKENEEATPVFTFKGCTAVSGTDAYEYCDCSMPGADKRGIYDVEVDVTDTTTGVMFSKRVNKLITVTPGLAPEPVDRTTGYRDILATTCFTSYTVGNERKDFFIRLWENTGNGMSYAELAIPSGEQNNTSFYPAIDISVLPAGTTLVLQDDPLEPAGYKRRLSFKGNNPCSVSAASGTPNFTREKPLIITINQDTPYHVPFQFYSGLNFENNCRNIVLDGRGYKNLSKGIHIHKYDKETWGSNCMFLTNGTSDIELVELELSDCDFTAISAKTDPDPNRPWYWFGNFDFANLWLHHSHIHDAYGEGFYIGYFSPETQRKANSNGEIVAFRPHAMTNTKIYRNRFNHIGYDGMQLSNARGAEVCYNEVYDVAFRGEKDQVSGISIQSVSGKCYNNIVHKYIGPGLQIGPLGDLDVFNNLFYGGPEGTPGVQLLFMEDVPEQNPNGNEINDSIKMYIHNNVIICNGVGINGRNTVQMLGLYTEDNIIIYRNSLFGNMATDTIAKWKAQATGNLALNKAIIDYVEIDSYKIADSANGNFQLASDSPLIKAGTGGHFKFDFRGYKNWYRTVSPTGAYMGVYQSADINDEPIVLTSVTIDDGAAVTKLQKVSVKLVYTGAATRYRIGETADLTAAPWADIPAGGVPDYALTDGYGIKTVYVQVGSGSFVSTAKSDTIEYQSTPLVLSGIVLNDGVATSRHLTVPVAFTYSGSFAPVKYRLGETADLAGVAWTDIPSGVINYTFAAMGQKTLYGQLQDAGAHVTDIKSAGISLMNIVKKAIVSFGYGLQDIPNTTDGLSIYDAATGITRFQNQNDLTINRKIYDTVGEPFGTAVPSTINSNMLGQKGCEGAITGNDSGVYPDAYLAKNSLVGDNKLHKEFIAFTLPAGTYKVRILANTVWNVRPIPNEALLYKAVTDTNDVPIALPASGVHNNTANMSDAVTVAVGADGLLKIEFGTSGATAIFYYAPLNIIEIEEV